MPSQQELFEKIAGLTEAVARLAARDDRTVDEATQQRVDFGYRALGRLMGRTGDSFNVVLVRADRRPERVLLIRDLPRAADWVEIRAGDTFEPHRIRRVKTHKADDAGYTAPRDKYAEFISEDAAEQSDSEAQRGTGLGLVPLGEIADTTPIDSIVVLKGPSGPLIALGPRLPGLTSTSPVS